MFLDNLSTSVLRLCGEKDLTYESAAELCELSPRYFGSIARKRTVPSLVTLEKLCIGLETTPNSLLLASVTLKQLSFREEMPVTEIHCMLCTHGLVGYPVCPQCRAVLDREYQAYCDRCGQCLSWDSYKNATVILPPKVTLQPHCPTKLSFRGSPPTS